ncbi:trehalose-phosphatase [Blastococcus sp. TF02-09]|uniref:trehalose-phosphatase n=1 Tax=Blastococcus sp. TF02-09 TaxID=2250576 RepID=UPI000DE88883|nr:trehalose-phosphatase [Blastococcus sp. TF02-9]RBY76490.1 trehalose-phosphatase [Blastococcus sp. TF02-9]
MGAPPADLGAALAALVLRGPLLVASDYDGVLAPLTDVPSEASPEPGVAEVLGRLAAVPGVTVALVSGRGLADLQATSGFTGNLRWIGSHGAEFGGPLTGDLAGRRDALVARLEPLVAGTPGARLEIKPASVAVHVRQVPDRPAAAALLERSRAAVDPSLTMKPGKDVFEVAVTDADKGSAVRRLAGEIGARGVLYLGDDVTDEDVFRVLDGDDVGVKVGAGETAAAYRVADPPAVRALLEHLADLLS